LRRDAGRGTPPARDSPNPTRPRRAGRKEDAVIPKDLLYAKSHEWALVEGDVATVGITQFAQEQLGDLTYVELPEVGDTFEAGSEMGSVESVKAASEIYAPVSGEIIEVNAALADAPEIVNQDPYGEGWLVKFKIAADPEDLLSADEYEELVAQDAH
jgi:glycine cleavage system H protein